MDDPRSPFREWLIGDQAAHPNSPAGGVGPGSGKIPGALSAADLCSGFVHPDAPAARVGIAAGEPEQPPLDVERLSDHLLQIDSLIDVRAAKLRDSLPDPSLRELFRAHVGYAGSKFRREMAIAHNPARGADVLPRLRDLIKWIDPVRFGGFSERRVGDVPGRTGRGGALRSGLVAFGHLVEQLFATAEERAAERWAAAEAAGARAQRSLLYEWTRRLELYAWALQGRPRQEGRQEAQRFTPTQLAPPPPEKTWVEFELVDENGKPAAGEAYEVMLPGGAQRTGTLNARGKVRFDDIDPGQCQIRFPAIDGRDWTPAPA